MKRLLLSLAVVVFLAISGLAYGNTLSEVTQEVALEGLRAPPISGTLNMVDAPINKTTTEIVNEYNTAPATIRLCIAGNAINEYTKHTGNTNRYVEIVAINKLSILVFQRAAPAEILIE